MAVTKPHEMNEAFARAFNARSLDAMLALYEPRAVHQAGPNETQIGFEAIGRELQQLLQAPGTMTSRNNFCIEHGDLALLRADWDVVAGDGAIIASGSSAEIARRQPDGTWRYVIDHAVGASLPRVG